MTRFEKVLFPAIILFFAFASCSPSKAPLDVKGGTQPSPVPGQVNQGSDGYPASNQSVNAPTQSYPGPAVTQADPKANYPASVTVPQPKAGLGVITGSLIQAVDNKPYLAPTLILGKLVYSDDPSAPPLVGYSAETDPKATEDQTGKFVFEDIQPGKYAIVLWSPGSASVLSDKEGKTVMVEVLADKVVDLGVIPIP